MSRIPQNECAIICQYTLFDQYAQNPPKKWSNISPRSACPIMPADMVNIWYNTYISLRASGAARTISRSYRRLSEAIITIQQRFRLRLQDGRLQVGQVGSRARRDDRHAFHMRARIGSQMWTLHAPSRESTRRRGGSVAREPRLVRLPDRRAPYPSIQSPRGESRSGYLRL